MYDDDDGHFLGVNFTNILWALLFQIKVFRAAFQYLQFELIDEFVDWFSMLKFELPQPFYACLYSFAMRYQSTYNGIHKRWM